LKLIRIILLLSCSVLSLNAQNIKGRLTNLGPQIYASVIQGSTFLQDKNGRQLVYTVVRGNPARLLAYTIDTRQMVLNEALPGTDGAWDMAVSSDGWLYVPGAKGMLYRHMPGTETVENLGLVLPEQTTVWNLAAGKNGEMFGATYPGCRVFRYHPNDGFADIGKGPLVETENYVRSLAYYEKTGKLYAGVGSHAELIELDPKTGSKKSILPQEFKNKEFVYSIEIIKGSSGADRMLTLITNGSFTLVYNLQTGKFDYQIDEMDMKALSQENENGRMYYTFKSGLYSRDLAKPQQAPVKHYDEAGSANAMLIREEKLYILNSDAVLLVKDLKSGKVETHKLEIPGQPITIQSIMKGPDGRIWSGGYLAGGHAAYDPKSNKLTAYPGLHQTEGMTVKDQFIYFGIYPKGHMYEYDTRKEWDVKKSNPRFLGQIHDQSRPFAVLNEKLSGKIFFGMVPEYGKLGGALVSYDPFKKELKSYGTVIQDQSIVSLVASKGVVWGGTSVSGGLGVMHSTKEAKLFSWDVQKGQKTDEIVPVEGAYAITSLIQGPDGNIWGMAGGTLFVFDPLNKKVLRKKEIYPTRALKSHVWRDAFLILHPSGMIYGTGGSQLFRVNPLTMDFEILEKPASLLAMDDQGMLYFHRSAELWQYDPGTE
jgi:hypothetical protein